jgi:indole-3-glycerol phosphate synthase
MILTKIIEQKKTEIDKSKSKISQKELLRRIEDLKAHRRHNFFKNCISKPHKIHLIAEVKKASPSAGVIRKDFDPVKIASAYEANGASAISVLTDEKFFHGSLSQFEEVKKSVSIPVLRKDFIIDEYQIYESVLAGADAALLIADLLSTEELKDFISIGKQFNIDFLVEVHSEEDARKAIGSECEIIGINNRDLHTFKVDIKTTPRLLKVISKEKIIVSESGITTNADVSYLKSLGVNAVLIGEVLMRSDDIDKKIKELMG